MKVATLISVLSLIGLILAGGLGFTNYLEDHYVTKIEFRKDMNYLENMVDKNTQLLCALIEEKYPVLYRAECK